MSLANQLEATREDERVSLLGENARLRVAMRAIIERSKNGELGTSKVIDMRKIAEEALRAD